MELTHNQKKFILSRFLYTFGEEIMSDSEYDSLFLQYSKDYPDWEYIIRNYEEDPVPISILKEFNYGNKIDKYVQMSRADKDQYLKSAYGPLISEASNKGIHATWNWQEGYAWFENQIGKLITATPKIDGCNLKILYLQDSRSQDSLRFCYAGTRGDIDKSFNVTENSGIILPAVIHGTDNQLIFRGDCTTPEDIKTLITSTVGKPFKTSRGAALSLLRRTDYSKDLIKKVSINIFRVEGFNSLHEGLDFALANGFRAVPYRLINNDHPVSFDEFFAKISPLLHEIKVEQDNKDIVTDGVVFQVDDLKDFSDSTTSLNYDGGNIAFKMQEWPEDKLIGTIEDIVIQQSSSQFCCKAIVTPVMTRSGKEISTVNLYNCDSLISNDLHIGDRIKIRYVNETTVEFESKEVS